jgi:peptidoglycan/LPS O-acetylase OafA/YrhL
LRRTLRIFPLYYLYLCLIFFVASHFYAPLRLPFKEQCWFWAYLSNFKIFFSETLSIRGTGQLWSLAVEEQFYLCWPFLIASFPNKSIKRILVGIFFLSFLVRVLLGLLGYDGTRIQVFTFAKIDMLAAGALLAIYYKEKKLTLPSNGKRKTALKILLAVSCLFPAAFIFNDFNNLQAIRSDCFGLFFVCFVAAALLSTPNSLLHKILSFRPLTLVGKYSYSMYLFQTGIISVFCWALMPFLKTHIPCASLIWISLFCLSTTFSALFGWFTYVFFARFFLDLKDVVAPQRVSATQLVDSAKKTFP